MPAMLIHLHEGARPLPRGSVPAGIRSRLPRLPNVSIRLSAPLAHRNARGAGNAEREAAEAVNGGGHGALPPPPADRRGGGGGGVWARRSRRDESLADDHGFDFALALIQLRLSIQRELMRERPSPRRRAKLMKTTIVSGWLFEAW